ncbi:MAG: chemotaxis protein MotB [Thermoleophilaceae bacterium]|jgi:chemotaxis protein MotB|nr:chemotaxis protein MotB [Thermoleophilaceae bacterium]
MSARAGKKRRGPAAEHENEERWLLTYADMITLLMALFMVLFSIANVNQSKVEALSKSLNDAFNGKILPGGKAIQQTGAKEDPGTPSPTPPIPAITPLVGQASQQQSQQAVKREQDEFKKIKREVDKYAKDHGLQSKVQTTITQRGLVIRLLTDQVLFDSGQAELKSQSVPVLARVAKLLNIGADHDVAVEGHTDNIPIAGSVYPTNWELSTARASRVVRFLIENGASKMRMSAAGYAALHPIAENTTAAGRSRNRRVEIVLLRSKAGAATEQGGSSP